jgi:hypothetical protein
MRTLKHTGKLKSKKTIRTMTPLARKLAHLSRAMQSNLKRLAYLTEALYELERAEKAAQAQIAGHALVCPLAHEPRGHEWPELPNGEGVLDFIRQSESAPHDADDIEHDGQGLEAQSGDSPVKNYDDDLARRLYLNTHSLANVKCPNDEEDLTASEIEEGRQPPPGCDPVTPGEGVHHG